MIAEMWNEIDHELKGAGKSIWHKVHNQDATIVYDTEEATFRKTYPKDTDDSFVLDDIIIQIKTAKEQNIGRELYVRKYPIIEIGDFINIEDGTEIKKQAYFRLQFVDKSKYTKVE